MALRDLFAWRTYDSADYSHSELLQRNEKIKAVSTFCNNAGLALLIAGVARWFDATKGFDGAAIAALCVGAVGVMLSIAICVFLKEVEWP
jgi:hypothetical protein